MSPLTVRPVEKRDRDEWLRMRAALLPDVAPRELADEIDAALAAGEKPVFVAARPDGRLAGYVEVSLRPYANGCASSPVGFLEEWFVDEDLRRRGVGATLINVAESWARARGCVEMASDTQIENVDSQRAHEALGYRGVERVVCFAKRLA